MGIVSGIAFAVAPCQSFQSPISSPISSAAVMGGVPAKGPPPTKLPRALQRLVIYGTPLIGQTLIASLVTWDNATSIVAEWRLNGALYADDSSGERTIVVPAGSGGSVLSYHITASNDEGSVELSEEVTIFDFE